MNTPSILQAFAAWLAAGDLRIGELFIRPLPDGEYDLRHRLDAGLDNLVLYSSPTEARGVALYDTEGGYRPLKSAPTLPRGWHFQLPTLEALRETIDIFYPAALALRLAKQQGRLTVTPLRETLGRQTGMYAITRKLTDTEAQSLVAVTCNSESACLKTILWPISAGDPITSLPGYKFDPDSLQDTIPLLCHEACNILVARAREVVKQRAIPSEECSAAD